jgi:hypothetical protein
MRKLFSLIFCIPVSYCLNAQTNFNKIIPPTPEAAHLQREVKIPVDYTTGIPNISIPLFELNTGSITIPISLSYHASGIKIDQLSSSVGLGWGLNAGGAIQRSIRGKADEGGWFNENFTKHLVDSLNTVGTYAANAYMMTDYDFAQDDYSYNFLGFGGNFFYDSTKTLRYVLKEKLELESQLNSGLKFKAWDYLGNTYFFDSTDISYLGGWPSTSSATSNSNGGITSWRLTKIKQQDIDSVTLDYERYHINYELATDDIYDAKLAAPSSCGTSFDGTNAPITCGQDYETGIYYNISAFDYDNSLIKKITSRDVQVDFYYSNDSNALVWKRRLDSIVVKSLVDSSVKKRIHLLYSRFSNDQLKLKAVREIDLKTGNAEETRFEYYTHSSYALPTMGSHSRDLFGYYNGKNNTYLINSDDASYLLADADRTINPQAIVLGSLQKIIYPSGGFTEFLYEPHKVDTSSMYAPGLRVKEIDEYNAINGQLNQTTYSYFKFAGVSVGFPFNMLPRVITAGANRKIFSSNFQDGPYPNYIRSFSSLVPHGYVYDSVVASVKGNSYDLRTSYAYDHIIIHDGFKSIPLEVKYYKYNSHSGGYNLIKEQNVTFEHLNLTQYQTPLVEPSPVSLNCWVTFSDYASPTYSCISTRGLDYQYLYAHILYKTKDLTKTYSEGNTVTEETRYYHANLDHLLPTRIVTLTSNDSAITVIKYPTEMVSGGLDGTGIYQTMVDNHLRTKEVIKETLDAQNVSLAKTITSYANGWISGSSFIGLEAVKLGMKGNTPEMRKQVHAYDQYGNITEYSEDSVHNTILWDYKSTLPVAKVNGTRASVAYTGFETNQWGAWTLSGGNYTTSYAVTGKRSYVLSTGNSITSSSLPTADYIISYWSRDGSLTVNSGSGIEGLTKDGWTYYEHFLASATSITISCSGNHTIDELRLYPKGSLMSTYTYTPLLGMTTACDMNNRINYYEFNGSGRLEFIRNADRQILKRIGYHLTQSGSSTMYYNEELSQVFTRNNCDSGYESTSELMYVVPAGRYSSSISQDEANQQAQNEINNLGQQYTNKYGSCTLICASCPIHPRKRCINGICENGMKVYTSSVYNSGTGKYDCIYHYEFSDGFWSIPLTEENDDPCL